LFAIGQQDSIKAVTNALTRGVVIALTIPKSPWRFRI
jgi:hypothetical protein